jgi:hypothetical protein
MSTICLLRDEGFHNQKCARAYFYEPTYKLTSPIAHCLDIVRQRLMCIVDTDVFGAVWVNLTSPRPFVDFNTQHVCKNFEAIRDWAERNQESGGRLPSNYWDPPSEGVYIYDKEP